MKKEGDPSWRCRTRRPIPRPSTTHKDYVSVVARHELGGRIRPVAYQLPGGSPVTDCVTDERQAASLKSGGCRDALILCKVTVDEVQVRCLPVPRRELWFMEAIPTQGAAPRAESRTRTVAKSSAGGGIIAKRGGTAAGMDVLAYCKPSTAIPKMDPEDARAQRYAVDAEGTVLPSGKRRSRSMFTTFFCSRGSSVFLPQQRLYFFRFRRGMDRWVLPR